MKKKKIELEMKEKEEVRRPRKASENGKLFMRIKKKKKEGSELNSQKAKWSLFFLLIF